MSTTPFPALYLLPLDNSFYPPKRIPLTGTSSGVIRIGRQLNAKSSPSAENGVFESRVLSRQHAEVWLELPAGDGEGGMGKGKERVLIRDVKSSNGTFVNGERLSLEGVESAPWEVRSDDILEFGIDIIGEQGEVVHRKVAARATCAFSEAEAQRAVRVEQRVYPPASNPNPSPSSSSPSPSSSSSGHGVTFASPPPALRRPQNQNQNQQQQQQLNQSQQQQQQAGLAGMGGMGSERIRPKSGDFDSILARLRDGPRAGDEQETHAHGHTETKPEETTGNAMGQEPSTKTNTHTQASAPAPPSYPNSPTTIESLRVELEHTRRQLESAAVSAAALTSSAGVETGTETPRIIANARFLSAELSTLREQVGVLQRKRDDRRRRRRQERERELRMHADDDEEEDEEEDGWEDLGLGLDIPRPPRAMDLDGVPDSPLAFEHHRAVGGEQERARTALATQLDVLEEQLGRLQRELEVMTTTAEFVNEPADGLGGLVQRVDRLEESLAASSPSPLSSPSPSSSPDTDNSSDSEMDEIKAALSASMQSLQQEWELFRASVSTSASLSTSTTANDNDNSGTGTGTEALARWLAAGNANGGASHVQEASEDSEVRFPGRWTSAMAGTSAMGATTGTGVGFGFGFGLLTPAGSVSARTGNGNGHVQLSAPPPPTHSHSSRLGLKGVSIQPSTSTTSTSMDSEEVLLLLGALGAGAAIVGAAWWGAA
ncbi:hypothetical protein C8F01DRAFT_1372035 [Mycena amicta]|nr:hypothetical protein C8F01DRAFT_1372035 [Mycena amicta]